MRRRDRLAIASLSLPMALVGAIMVASIQSPDQVSYLEPSASAQSSGAQSQVLREALVSRPQSITPLTAQTQADRDLVALLFRGLVKAGRDGSLVPDLATRWSTSDDGKTWTFELRSDATWEDGKPVTADDVAFTAGLAADPDYTGPLGSSWQGIAVEAVSPTEVTFTLPTPLGGFLRQAALPVLPQHLLADTAVADLAGSGFASRPVGDGPFRISELDDSHALLTRAPDAGGTGNVAQIELRFFGDQASAVKAFKSGAVDAVGGLTPTATTDAAGRVGATAVSYPATNMYAVVLNQRSAHPEFATAGVRRGLLSAVHRSSIIADVLGGHGTLADAPLPSWSNAYDPKAVATTLYEPTAAADSLTAAGWTRVGTSWAPPNAKGAYSIRLLAPSELTNPVGFAIAGRVAADWKSLGLTVTVESLAPGDYVQKLTNGDFDAAVADYRLGLDPDVSALFLSTQIAPIGSNLSGVSDKTLDGLLGAVRTTADPAGRQKAVSNLEGYISTNALMLPVCFADYEFVVAGRVGGLQTSEIGDPSSRYWDVLDWRLASDG